MCKFILLCTATPAEAINHYYCFLADNLDNNAICQTMLKLEIITEECLVNSAKMCSDYQRNVFLLDQLLITDTFKIVEFCYALQSTDSEQEIGVMLVNSKITRLYCFMYSCVINNIIMIKVTTLIILL